MTTTVVCWNIAKRRKPWQQLVDMGADYVFASRGFHNSVKVRAMNGVEEWGASDHCRLLIKIGVDAETPRSE